MQRMKDEERKAADDNFHKLEQIEHQNKIKEKSIKDALAREYDMGKS